MDDRRIPLSIPVKPWFQDHCFGGKIVLPAVETMLLIAAYVTRVYPDIDVTVMENCQFAKFLEIPPGTATVDALFECDDIAGRMQVKLLSRQHFKSMSRIKEHCEIFFSPVDTKKRERRPVPSFAPEPPVHCLTEVDVQHLYRELVPFGPMYQTLKGTLYLSANEAWGKLQAPGLSLDPIQAIIGSPFPMDGALHAACVLGQQSVDFVPFPVGFARRAVLRPTQPGCWYITKVRQISQTNDELVFDVAIWDNDGLVYEIINGVRMRDVSSAVTSN